MELVAFASIPAVIIFGIVIYYIITYRHKQRTIASVNILLDRLKRLEQEDFRITSDFLAGEKPPSGWNQKQEIIKFLNYFEDLGLLVDQKLTKLMVIRLHGDIIRAIKQNKHAQKIIKEYQKNDGSYYYIFLNKLFEKV